MKRSSTAFSIGLFAITLLGVGCTHPGYRDEVYPDQEGQYTIKRVPISEDDQHPSTPATAAQASAMPTAPPTPTAATPPAPAPPPTDPGLSTVESLWPQLSEADRASIVNLTSRLAAKK